MTSQGGRNNGPTIRFSERIGECLSDVLGFGFEGGQAYRWANRLNRRYGHRSELPVDAEKIALLEGFRIKSVAMSDRTAAVLDQESHAVFVNGNKDFYRKWGNFAVAAAIGHWYLEHPETIYTVPVDIKPFTGQVESALDVDRFHAGIFAGHLLMSDKSMRRYASSDLDVVASGLQVPAEIVSDWQSFRQRRPRY